jgi:hypothetical protein
VRMVFTLGALLCLGGGAYAAYLIVAEVILPWVRRLQRKAEIKRAAQEKLDEIILEQQLTTSQQAWDDLQVHRERLERSLDNMHNNTGGTE